MTHKHETKPLLNYYLTYFHCLITSLKA